MGSHLLEQGNGQVVDGKDQGADEIRENASEVTERVEEIEHQATPRQEQQRRQAENGMPKFGVCFGEGIFSSLAAGQTADGVLQDAERADDGAVDTPEQERKHENDKESRRAKRRDFQEIEQ